MSDLCLLPEHLSLAAPIPEGAEATASPLTGPKVQVMVVDDQALFRSGLVRLLEDDGRLQVVAVSPGGPDVPNACAALGIDVVVTELQLALMDGIELTRLVSTTSPTTRVLILTSAVDSRVVLALAAGAAGFLLKDAEPEAIRSAVLSVHLGDQVFCREAARWLVGTAGGAGAASRYRGLTQRETEVLRMVAHGLPNKGIATSLRVSEKTVRNYVSRLYRKLALRSRSQLATYALQSGITESIGDA
jgi:DNA-binding NarL/FixJ family response regulator